MRDFVCHLFQAVQVKGHVEIVEGQAGHVLTQEKGTMPNAGTYSTLVRPWTGLFSPAFVAGGERYFDR